MPESVVEFKDRLRRERNEKKYLLELAQSGDTQAIIKHLETEIERIRESLEDS